MLAAPLMVPWPAKVALAPTMTAPLPDRLAPAASASVPVLTVVVPE
jgi:hypothetical protein